MLCHPATTQPIGIPISPLPLERLFTSCSGPGKHDQIPWGPSSRLYTESGELEGRSGGWISKSSTQKTPKLSKHDTQQHNPVLDVEKHIATGQGGLHQNEKLRGHRDGYAHAQIVVCKNWEILLPANLTLIFLVGVNRFGGSRKQTKSGLCEVSFEWPEGIRGWPAHQAQQPASLPAPAGWLEPSVQLRQGRRRSR